MRAGLSLSPAPGIVLSVALHVGGLFLFGLLKEDPQSLCGNGVVDVIAGEECDDGNTNDDDGCSSQCRREYDQQIEVELQPDPPPPKPEPEPEPPPPPEPPPEPQVEPPPPPKPPPKRVRKKKPDPPPPPPAAPPPPPTPTTVIDIDLGGPKTIGGVKVVAGDVERPASGRPQGKPGGTVGGKPGGTGPKGNTIAGTGGRGRKWAPPSELQIAQMPRKVRVAELNCPAVRELGIAGDVVMKVQVRRDGSVRGVRVIKGIGNGCNEIAKRALRKAKFKPALTVAGKPADFELRYTYSFELQ